MLSGPTALDVSKFAKAYDYTSSEMQIFVRAIGVSVGSR